MFSNSFADTNKCDICHTSPQIDMERWSHDWRQTLNSANLERHFEGPFTSESRLFSIDVIVMIGCTFPFNVSGPASSN